ncbi:unnamed protein product [Lampetra planeri]
MVNFFEDRSCGMQQLLRDRSTQARVRRLGQMRRSAAEPVAAGSVSASSVGLPAPAAESLLSSSGPLMRLVYLSVGGNGRWWLLGSIRHLLRCPATVNFFEDRSRGMEQLSETGVRSPECVARSR